MNSDEKTMLPEEGEKLSQKQIKKVKNAEKHVKNYQFFILRLLILILVLWVLFFKVIGLTHMPTGDMYPRIDLGDFVMYYRLDKDVSKQDVVVLEKQTPDSKGKKLMYICRVVAIEGDTVEITEEGQLLVNGTAMIERNIYSLTLPYEGYTKYPLTLGEGECFVLADQRDGASDSRYFGVVQKSDLIGTVIAIVRRNNL